jgi:hypothetical protein
MKNFDLNLMGVQEMNALDMKETDGGLVLFLICLATGLLLASCVNGPVNVQVGGTNNNITPTGGGTIRADSCKLEIPMNLPIGY